MRPILPPAPCASSGCNESELLIDAQSSHCKAGSRSAVGRAQPFHPHAAYETFAVMTMVLSNPRKTRSAAGAPMSYELLISSIAGVHARTQTDAAAAVNRYLTLRNWFIGAYVVQFEQNGADRA